MGDVRFEPALERVIEAQAEGGLDPISPETGVEALGALAASSDPVLANVLTTRLLNQFRRSATLLRFVGEGVVALDTGGRVLFANPAAERMLGRGEGDLLGQDFHDSVDHRARGGRRVHRRACPVLNPGLRPGGKEDTFRRPDGQTFRVEFLSAPMKTGEETTGLAVIFRDVSDEAERKARLALHATALNNVPVPVFWLDRRGSVRYANRAAEEHLGRSREELVALRVFEFDPDFTPKNWRDHWRRVAAAGGATFHSRHRHASGRLLPVRIDVAHVTSGGTAFHVAVVHPLPAGGSGGPQEVGRP